MVIECLKFLISRSKIDGFLLAFDWSVPNWRNCPKYEMLSRDPLQIEEKLKKLNNLIIWSND